MATLRTVYRHDITEMLLKMALSTMNHNHVQNRPCPSIFIKCMQL